MKRAKKFLSLLLTLCLLVSVVVPVTAADSTSFADVSDGAWYNEAVTYVSDNGLMNGTSDDLFEPNAGLTRAMFVTVLGRLDGVETDSVASADFSDV